MLKKIDSQRFLRFSLMFVLVASLRHVAWGFGTLESSTSQCSLLWLIPIGPCNVFWGYAQAIAFDLAVVALSYGLENRKRNGLATGWYWVGVIAFCAVSTYANMLYGLVFSSAVQASADWPRLSQWMVYAKPFVLSGILPVMLVYISHITASYGQKGDRVPWPPLDVQLSLFLEELGDVVITPDEAVRKFEQLTGMRIATRHLASALASRNLKRLSAKVDSAIDEGVQGEQGSEALTIRSGADAPTVRTAQAQQAGELPVDVRRARVREMSAQGMSRAAIARELGVHPSTVKRDLEALAAEVVAVRGNGKVREKVV